MALTPNFTATQLLGLSSTVVVTDTSTGSDVAITSRRVYFRTDAGAYIVPSATTTDYVAWSIANSSINIDVLTKDMALYVRVEWLDVNGIVLYYKETLYGFKSFNEDFLYQLSGYLANNYKRTADAGFNEQVQLCRTYIDSGDQAISLGGDIMKGQTLYDLATNIRTKAQYLFNTV
jgi:hypothetical protein